MKNRDGVSNHDEKQFLPNKAVIAFLAVWIALFFLYAWLRFIRFYPNPPVVFPISEIYVSTASIFSFFPLIFFIGILIIVFLRPPKKMWGVYLVCLGLIFFGNMLQGGIEQGFIYPLVGTTAKTPFYDVTHLRGGFYFINNFNAIQMELTNHTVTHPPFLVLIWYFLNQIGGVLLTLIGSILIISSMIPFFYWSLQLLGFSPEKAGRFTVLLALIPAFNIYSILSPDAIAAAGYMIFLWGMVSIYKKGLHWYNLVLLSISFIFANMLNYLAFGLLGIIGLAGIWQWNHDGRKDLLIGMLVSAAALIGCMAIWKFVFQYDHLQGFLTSIRYEDLKSSSLTEIQQVRSYFFSRGEDISEVMLFLSFGVLAVLLSPKYRRLALNLKSIESVLLLSAFTFFALLMVMGVFRTGETARPFIWLIPYILIALRNISDRTLNALIGLAALQTIVMQLAANYYW